MVNPRISKEVPGTFGKGIYLVRKSIWFELDVVFIENKLWFLRLVCDYLTF